MSTSSEVTELLAAARDGDGDAMDRLFSLIYQELRSIAHYRLGRRRSDQTLDTTALVNEVYLKLADPAEIELKNRSHFMAVASLAMRQVLVDHARSRVTQKRGAGAVKVEFDEAQFGRVETQADQLLALDEALTNLSKLDERQTKVVEMRFFVGLSVAEIAAALGVTDRTVKRDWKVARAFLRHQLSGRADDRETGSENG